MFEKAGLSEEQFLRRHWLFWSISRRKTHLNKAWAQAVNSLHGNVVTIHKEILKIFAFVQISQPRAVVPKILEICGLNCKMPHPIWALERNACLIQFLILALYIYIVCSFITYASPHPFTFFLTYLLPYLHFPYYWHMVGLLQCACIDMPLVLWRCWLGFRKGIRPVKNWVVGRWHGYLSGARCRLAYGPADATATHCLLLQ